MRSGRMPGFLIFLLAWLATLGSLAIHAFVPALPTAARDLGVPAGSIQMSISLYLLGLAAGQLAGGWSSDLVGRRPIMLAGTALYTAGSLLGGLAVSLPMLLIGRVVQAFGGACLLSVGRTIVADVTEGPETARRLAVLGMISLLSPTFAPLLGSLLVDLGGWRCILLVLAAFGMIGCIGATLLIPETRSPAVQASAGPFHGFRRVLFRWAFWRFTLAGAATSAGLFGFLAASSFVLTDIQGLTAAQSGIAYALIAGAAMIGAIGAARAGGDMLRTGSLLHVAGATILLMATAVAPSPVALVLPMMVVAAGTGMVTPTALAGALRADPDHRGSASSLIGAFQVASAAATTAATAAFFGPSVMTAVLPVAGAAAILLMLLLFNRGD